MKWIYKFIFSIVLVAVGLFMLSEKEVKAQQQEFAPMMVKATFVSSTFIDENVNTYEWVVTYKVDNAIIENLNRTEYFFTARYYFAFDHTTFRRDTNSYVIEEIQIEDNSTVFYVRIALSSARFNQYYGILENSDELFGNDSAFYVYCDLYSVGYNDGFNDGYGGDLFNSIKVYNLVWRELKSQTSDTQSYDLVVEIEPGIYRTINQVIVDEIETLNPNGVIIFQYPRSLSSPTDTKTITFYPSSGNPIHYNNIDYMVVKKSSNRLELYINNDTYIYQPYNTRIEGFRVEYIADWDYQDGYNDGYNKGYQDGREKGYEAGKEDGYELGKEDGKDEVRGEIEEEREKAYNRGYEDGKEEGERIGYNKGLNEQIADRDFAYLLRSAFVAIGTFLGINLLPGISIGAIIAVPIVFGIIAFIIGKRKD